MSSSQSPGVSPDYKLLREWDEEKEEELEEDDLNFNTYSNGSFRRSIIYDYISNLKADLSNRRGSASAQPKYGLPIQGSRKGLMAAIGVGLVLIALLISVSVYATQHSSGQTEINQRLVAEKHLREDSPNGVTLVDVLTGKYSSKSFNGTWVSGTQIQYMDMDGNITLYDVSQNEVKVILPGELFLEKLGTRPFEVTLSPDLNFAMVGYGSQRVYRHSITAKYAIYEFASGNFYYLTPQLGDQIPGNPDLLQLVEWSPANNAVAFVYEHDVYYRAAPNGVSIRLSDSGAPDIYNGVADWVYEEEMFSTSQALWFSPDGSHIAFATFNDTNVQSIEFSVYGDPGMFPLYQYPLQERIPYPKAGTPNPDVSLTVVNLMNLADRFEHTPAQEYIGTVYWASNTNVVVADMNRAQNVTQNYVCSSTGACQQPFYSVNQAGGWIDINTPLASKTGQSFIFLQSIKQVGTESSYRHIVRFNLDGTSSPITSGKFSVDSIQGWDEDNSRIFYSATGYNTNSQLANPAETHLYVFNTTDMQTKCLTCGISNSDSIPCQTNSFSLSKNYEYVAHTCTGPGIPEATIRTVNDMSQVKITWVDNAELREKLVNINQPKIQDYDVPLASGFTAKARLWLPPNYEKGKKYPMLVDVYAGPGSQKITHKFGIDWGTSLVTSRNVIYASIDGRGSGRQSDDLLFQLNRRMGTVEIEDQIAVAKWLLENNTDDVIDGNKTAIWGWSYGGYATAMVMGTDKENIYKCGISVAPVTSWVFYDTIYTERYMGLPTRNDNLQGYNSSDVTNHVANFRTKKYYLIHGNADDNVHYQQSMLLSRALEKADILFRQQSYPDENHGLNGVRRHLYHSLEDFLFRECF